LLDTLVLEIERCDEDRPPLGWNIASNSACQADPDRLVFGPSLEELSDPADCVVRSTRIPARLIADVATLFHDTRIEAA
jgi:hypothetical protein